MNKFRSEYWYLDRYPPAGYHARMSYAILRTAKLTSFANVSSSAAHNFRERKTPNADPDRTPNNATSGAQSSKDVIATLKSRLETVPTVRKNAVLAIEYFIGASPEWFKENSEQARESYFNVAEKWLKQKHGAENVIAFTRQYDETSPHVCAYVVPIDPRGKLNCSHFLDGRTKLSEMQTEFAEQVGQRFGLERGIEGSEAKHQTIKQYYAKIQAPTPEVKTKVPDVPEPTTSQKMAAAMGVETEHSRALEQQEAARRKLAAEIRAQRAAEQAKAKQYDAEKAANKARDVRLAELRATATQARDLPLESVLDRLGCRRDPDDKHNWRTPVGRLTVDGSKFYVHDLAKGGGGAIDLVMLVEETDYKGAVNRLAGEFGTGAVLAQAVATLKPVIEEAAKAPPEPYRAPEPKPENWPKVREYLTETRCLSGHLVDKLHELGKVYADRYSNAVFVLAKGAGVELRGTTSKPFHGVRGEKSAFILAGQEGEKKVAFVESSIEAISLRELGFNGRIVSLTGNSANLAKEMAGIYRQQGMTVIAAFNNDKAGEKMSAGIAPAERMRPERKDWNDDLKAKRGQEKAPDAPVRAQTEAELIKQIRQTVEPQKTPRGPSMDR